MSDVAERAAARRAKARDFMRLTRTHPDRPKDPKRVRAGQLGAQTRWGEPRIVRLDTLTMEQRRLVLALVDAARNEATAPTGENVGAVMSTGGTPDATSTD